MFEATYIRPNLRLLGAIRKNLLVTCFFINEGDGIKDVEIQTTHAALAEIYPIKELKARDTGAIKFTGCDPGSEIKFRLCFSTGDAETIYKDFIFSESDKKIFPAN